MQRILVVSRILGVKRSVRPEVADFFLSLPIVSSKVIVGICFFTHNIEPQKYQLPS